ncbi:MAG: alpha/beta hydrolase [Bifidobacteriaceae bacterium]|nr:alpha/beta hydrolase [Bifidobacteriaceae bacterium]
MLGPLVAEVRGEGPTVVLLHGNGEDARLFDGIVDYLTGFRVVTLEARGHGRTPVGPQPLTIAHLAKDVAAAIGEGEARGVMDGKVFVVGFSDGANVAMELAIHRLPRVRGLVLIGGNCRPSGMKVAVHIAIVVIWAALALASLVSTGARRRARVWGLMVGQPRITDADLARIDVPTLVVAGERDVVARRHTERTAQVIRGADMVIVPGRGHMLPTEAPEVLGPAIASFLNAEARSGNLGGQGHPGAATGPTWDHPDHSEDSS